MFDLFVTVLWVTVMVLWLVLFFHVVLDVLRSHDLGGPAKALWLLFLIVLPLVGVLVYVVARGGSMHEREAHFRALQRQHLEDYIRSVAHDPNPPKP
jgi:hypothetical protein